METEFWTPRLSRPSIVAGPRPAVRKILQVTGLDSVFVVHDDAATVVPPTAG